MNTYYPHIAAIIVTYRFEQSLLVDLIDQVAPQVGTLFVVDNNAQATIPDSGLPDNVISICNGTNVGLAAALNQGLEAALAGRFRHLLLLDQDSRPEPAMIGTLATALDGLQQRRKPTAAVGPAIVEQNRGATLPFIRYRRLRRLAIEFEPHAAPIACDMLLTSGTLVDVTALRAIGLMDASLFVYGVDTEWCLRAICAGYSLFGIPRARLHHRLGETAVRVPLLHGPVLVHPPDRQYLMARNYCRLMRRRSVPWWWKVTYFPHLIGRWVVFSTLIKPRWQNFLAISRGIRSGLTKG